MPDATYQKFVERWEEVTKVPPQSVGNLTPFYKRLAKRLKVMPWPLLVFFSFVFVIIIYLIIGQTITLLTSILQRGF